MHIQHIRKVDAPYYRIVAIVASLFGVCGITSLAGGFIWLSRGGSFAASGLWFDFQLIGTAVLGIYVRKKKTKQLMVWFFYMSLIALVGCFVQQIVIACKLEDNINDFVKEICMILKGFSTLLGLLLTAIGSALARAVAFGEEQETDTESTQRLIDFEFQYNNS